MLSQTVGAVNAAAAPGCTIIGTAKADVLRGTSAKDVICGRGGDDVLHGGDGDDTLVGGRGRDRLLAGAGTDEVRAGPGSDRVSAGAGQDTILGSIGDDILRGGAGDDHLHGGSGADDCGVPAEGETHVACEDLVPPTITEFDVLTPEVDTFFSAAPVTVRLRVIDHLSGAGGAISLRREGAPLFLEPFGPNDLSLLSGNANDGIYEVSVYLPRFSASGKWRITAGVSDRVGNSRSYGSDELNDIGDEAAVVQVGIGDTTRPTIAALEVLPTSIDTSGEARQLAVSLTGFDDISGATRAQVEFLGPSGNRGAVANLVPSGGVSPGAYVFNGVLEVPRFSEKGTWRLHNIIVHDAAGNVGFFDAGDLSGAGFTKRFEQLGDADDHAPTVEELDFTPRVVDTTASDQEMTWTLRLKDKLSGVSGAWLTVLSPGKTCGSDGCPNGRHSLGVAMSADHLISGDANDGVYRVTVTLPRFSELGTWRIRDLVLEDKVGNMQYVVESDPMDDYGTSQPLNELTDAGFTATFLNRKAET